METTTQQTKASLVERCARELAMNFDCPAPRIMGVYAARLGVSVRQLERLLMNRNGEVN